MHAEAYNWVKWLSERIKAPRWFLEIGSRDINGSVRPLFPKSEWIGIDISLGRGVDEIGDGCTWKTLRLFQAVVCTEVLEHCPTPELICKNALRILDVGGIFIVTAACPPRKEHSAIDGESLREGEWYRNILEEDLRRWLEPFGFFVVDSSINVGDIYAFAVKVNKD